eukprot:10466-Heterococcus_DN1.PRE.4
MNSAQQSQLQRVETDVQKLNSKVDALQHNLSAVVQLLTKRAHPERSSSSSAVTVAPASAQLCKRTRPEAASPASPFDDNEILGTVLSFVGYGEYFYVAGVCRQWRGRYISFCHAQAPANEKHKLRTLRRAVILTAARLQLALHCGATMTVLEKAPDMSRFFSLAYTVANSSLEPIAVLSLLRVYEYQWDSDLYVAAAGEGNLELIRWLQQVQCPIAAADKIAYECCGCMSTAAVSILQWLYALQPEWFNDIDADNVVNKTALLNIAGDDGNFVVMQWLRCELSAEWPSGAEIICNDNECTIIPQWDAEAVVWALDNGLQLEFECSKLDPEKQSVNWRKTEAVVLWQWLHKESNRHRCTCGNAQ